MARQRRKARRNAVSGSTRTSVNVLLADNVDNLGERGEIVRVKPGYARNYLLPQGLATVATDHNIRMVEIHKQRLDEIQAARLKDIRDLAKRIGDYSATLEANANQDGHLYGSIMANDISAAMKTAGFPVDPSHIRLEGPLKELGMYNVKIQLHSSVDCVLKVWVVPAASGN